MKGLNYLMVYPPFLVKVLEDIFQQIGKKTKKRKIQDPEDTEDLKGSPGMIADPQD